MSVSRLIDNQKDSSLKIERHPKHGGMEPAVDRDILGAATGGKITATVSAIDTNAFMHRVTNQSFETTVDDIVGDKAIAAAGSVRSSPTLGS